MLQGLCRFLFLLPMAATLVMPFSAHALEIQQGGLMPTTPQTAPLPQTRYPYRQPPKSFTPNIVTPRGPNFTPDLSPRTNHQTWCLERYDSYRRTDNTYKLPTGGRVPCVSPRR